MSAPVQNFTALFKKGEKLEIYGRKAFNFKVLTIILTFTFCAIGGANLALKDLEDKMSDPFVNLLSVDIPLSKQYLVESLKNELLTDSLMQRFDYENITNYVEFPLAFKGPERVKWVKGRSIDLNNPVLERLLNDDNLIAGSGFNQTNEIGLIISKRLLEDLDIDDESTHVDMWFNERSVPIPIRAIVKELPELNYFVASPFFFFQRTQLAGSAFDLRRNRKLEFFVKDLDQAGNFKEKLSTFLQNHEEYKTWDAEILSRQNNESYEPGTEFTIEFFGFRARESSDYDQIVVDIMENLNDVDFLRYYDYNFNNFPTTFQIDTDKIAINFTDLAGVRPFQEFLFNNFQIDVDIAKVRDKENFAFVKFLTEIISLLLIVFSIVSICFYLYNLLKNHLQKIRPNLGTFLAFGLDQRSLFILYRDLLLTFLLQATAVSLGISLIFLLGFSYVLDSGSNYFSIFDWKLLSALAILIGSFYLIFKHTIQPILVRTPGDLIYDR